MLTPEYLNNIEFNDVVELYNKLNIEIMADIISRISIMDDITAVSKEQMKILLQTNGTEIFNEALEKSIIINKRNKECIKVTIQKYGKRGYTRIRRIIQI